MARATLSLDSIDIVRRSGRTMSMRVLPDGKLKLNVPYGTNRRRIERFVTSRENWINKRRLEFDELYDFSPNARLAPGLTVKVEPAETLAVEDRRDSLIIYKPAHVTNWQAYLSARAPIKGRLNALAKSLLPGKTNELALRYGYEYSDLSVKFLRSRWGSCTSRGRISLNSQLLRLPEPLIEYVIMHELAHLKVARHSHGFYELMEDMLPNTRQMKRQLNKYRLLY